ncbi:MAG: hypothetical protein H6724_19615, partial [Sandaracinus sp.]|nr:hypothetical protein [Sandaracinus sp.]
MTRWLVGLLLIAGVARAQDVGEAPETVSVEHAVDDAEGSRDVDLPVEEDADTATDADTDTDT